MPLPESRKKTYLPGDPGETAEFNATQDAIVSIAGAKDFSVAVDVFRIIAGAPAWSIVNALVLAPGDEVEIRIPSYQGRILRGAKVRHVDAGAGVVTARVYKRESLAGGVVLTDTALSAAIALPNQATWQADSVTMTTTTNPSNSNREWYIRLSAAGGMCQVHRVLATMSDHT